jgi:hypothetical protein
MANIISNSLTRGTRGAQGLEKKLTKQMQKTRPNPTLTLPRTKRHWEEKKKHLSIQKLDILPMQRMGHICNTNYEFV